MRAFSRVLLALELVAVYKGIKVCSRFVRRREGPEHGRTCARLPAIWDQRSR